MKTVPNASVLSGWRRSSYSNGQGAECFEIADGFPGVIPVRDSKNPTGPALVFPAGGWSLFVAAVQRGKLPAA